MRYKIMILILVICLCGCERKEYSGEMDAVGSHIQLSSDGYMESLIVIVNQAEVVDYEECAKEIIEHCQKNDFKNIKFSYDVMGYPNVLEVTVYLTEKEKEKGEILFEMTYMPDSEGYNIKDNPEQYTLEIKRFD